MGIDLSTPRFPDAKRPLNLSAASHVANGGLLHVLTLTPFYPTTRDDAQGCFVAEPLPALSTHGVFNTVMAVQPFYRAHSIANPGAFPARQVRFISLPGGIGLPAAGVFLFANLLGTVRRLHRTNPVHMIHAHAALPCGHAAALLARELAIPFTVTVHGLDAYSTQQVSGRTGNWCQHVSNFVYRSANCVICISEKVRDRVLALSRGPVKTQVVYNGVDPEKFHPAAGGPHDLTILCVANLNPTKGHDLLLRAFASVQREFPDWSCELIGDGAERPKLEKLARESGLRAVFRGHRSRSEVAEAMRRCAIFALPSGYEGLGCVYLEAMASAKATLGCWKQGIEEVIEHGANGWLVTPGSADELSLALSQLMRNPQLCADLGAQARRTILAGFTLEHQAERLGRIYREYTG